MFHLSKLIFWQKALSGAVVLRVAVTLASVRMTRSAVPWIRRVALATSVTQTGSTAEAKYSNPSKAPATVGLKYCILVGSASAVLIS